MKLTTVTAMAAAAVLAPDPRPAIAEPPPFETRDLLAGNDPLQAFRPVEGWRGVAAVSAVEGETRLTAEGGGAILVNGATRDQPAPYLLTREEFGDALIELEFMIPQGSNSGVYVMGRYEVQILDSHGRERAGAGDLGGIYPRWDLSRPEGRQEFDGVAPKQNAARAPGQWQTLEIRFRAPRFDDDGRRIREAVFEQVLVNGVLVQDHSPATGPTRAAPLEGDARLGPVAIQGDHGPVAIRQFKVTPLPDLDETRLAELDAYWREIERAVSEGDMDAFKAGCHPDAVLVNSIRRSSQPLTQAMKRWQREFDDTRAGLTEVELKFRWGQRYGDAVTAHETGMFRYRSRGADGAETIEYIEFEALLRRGDDGWKMLMEHQKSVATEEQWQALAPPLH